MCTRQLYIYILAGCNVYQTTVYIILQGVPDSCIHIPTEFNVYQTTVYIFLQGEPDTSIYILT